MSDDSNGLYHYQYDSIKLIFVVIKLAKNIKAKNTNV